MGTPRSGRGARVFGSASGLAIGGGLLMTFFAYPLAPHIPSALATTPAVEADAVAYLGIIFIRLPAMMTLQLVLMALRGTGDSATPLWFMILNVGLDTSLNPMLIHGVGTFPKLGVARSATAMLTAKVVALLALVAYLDTRTLPLNLRRAELR